MYNPPRFQSQNTDEAFELMDKYPFATVVTVQNNEPFISHLPLTPMKRDGKIVLMGHLARANPHWKLLASGKTTAIFHGPHAYITPQWYTVNDVPTWNYLMVHASGPVKLIEDFEGIKKCLELLTNHSEKNWPSGWEFFVPDDLSSGVLEKAIVGFEIQAEQINFKKKLSQGGKAEDRAGVLEGLLSRNDDNSREVRNEMQKIYNPDGSFKA